MVFSRVNNASACVILSSPSTTVKDVTDKTKSLRQTHRIQTASCYINDNNKVRCIACFAQGKPYLTPNAFFTNLMPVTKTDWFVSKIEDLKYISVKYI